jgi:prepilin-type N-terminal cleavage/methylation domain-containing protein
MNVRHAARAFSLVELLIVIAIIAVIIALTIPALGSARDSSREIATKQLITNLTTAASTFSNDNAGRVPGYFSARDMGDAQNADRGMSGMENLLLDLAGQAAIVGGSASATGPIIAIGPTSGSQVNVNLDILGASSGTGSTAAKSYFTIDKKLFAAQDPAAGQQVLGSQAGVGQALMPDLIDYWGQPLLAWTSDEGGATRVRNPGELVKASNQTNRASMYWLQNAAFLRATSLGRKSLDQSTLSLVGSAATPTDSADPVRSLEAALGSPAAPYRDPADATAAPRVALKPRANLIVQSAGRDGVFLAARDRGRSYVNGTTLDYRFTFVTTAAGTLPADQNTDKDGKPTTIDIMDRFDDLFGYAGN